MILREWSAFPLRRIAINHFSNMVCTSQLALQFPKIYCVMKKDQKNITIKDFSNLELNVNEQKHVKGGEDEIVTEEDIID